MQLSTEGILQNLGEIHIPLQGGGVEPCGQRDRAVHTAIDAGQADRGHIDIHQDSPFSLLQLYAGQGRGGGDRLAVLLQAAEDAAEQLPGREKGIRIIGAAGGDIQIGESDGDLLAFGIGKDRDRNNVPPVS